VLVEVRLLGSLGQRFGRKYKLDIDTPAEAFRALAAQLDGFLDYIYEAAKSGIGWQVVDRDPLGMLAESLDLRIQTDRLIIAPRVEMGDGVGRIIAGAALIAFSFLVPGGFILSASTFGVIGAKLVLDGLSQLLTPTPDNRKADSETIGQAAQRGYQGLAVPILYGKVYINDLIPISATVYSEDIPLGTDGQGTVNWAGGTTPEVDPYPTLTKMLLHLDNNLVDAKGNTTPGGVVNSAFSSSTKVFGSYSFYMSGVADGSYISVPATTSLLAGTSSATFEGQYRIYSPEASNTANQSMLVGRYDFASSLGYYWLYDHTTQQFRFASNAFIANWAYTLPIASPIFHHLALSIDTLSHTANCFVDGVPLGAVPYPGYLGNPNLPLTIGVAQSLSTIEKRMKGYVDEFRLSIGIARYASTFTPPAASFANS
jgi:predicted phage tail protein